MQQQKSTESLEKDAKLYGKIFGEKSSNKINKIYFTTSGSSSPSQNTQLPSNEKNDVGDDIHEDAAGHVSGHVVLVVALCRPACCARADCTKATCPLCYRRMLAAPELCPCLDTGGAKLGINRTILPTCHRTLCAVQVLKIRRPNYFDFSVKTMVTMKLFQQQNVS